MDAISVMDIIKGQGTRFQNGEAREIGETEATNVKAAEKAEALAYLHKRFPEVEELELAKLLEQNASSISDILESRLAYEACSIRLLTTGTGTNCKRS